MQIIKFIGIIVGLLLLGATISSCDIAIAIMPADDPPEQTNVVERPQWNVGDSWSMGYEIDSELMEKMEEEMLADAPEGLIDIFDISGEFGIYIASTVKSTDTLVTIDGTDYRCYDVYFEAYLGVVIYIKFAADYTKFTSGGWYTGDTYDEESYEENYTSYSTPPPFTKMSMDGYIWGELDLTGHIYYTVDELAVAKEELLYKLNGEINFDMEMVPTEPNAPTISINYFIQIKDVIMDYEIIYDPPLDIFDFPIEPYEHWEVSSNVTVTVTELLGLISYEFSGNIPTGMGEGKVTMDLSKDPDTGMPIDLPQSFGPVEVRFELYNPGTEFITLPDGTSTECYMIDCEYHYGIDDYYEYEYEYDYGDYEDYYYSDEYMTRSWNSGSSTASPFSFMDPSAFEDFGNPAEAPDPVAKMATSDNYYSPEKGHIVATTPDTSECPGSMMASTTSETGQMTPKEYQDVTTFKSSTRAEYQTKHSEYKQKKEGPGEKEEPDKGLFGLGKIAGMDVFVLLVVIIVFVVVVVSIFIARKRRKVAVAPPPMVPPLPQQPPTPPTPTPTPPQPPAQAPQPPQPPAKPPEYPCSSCQQPLTYIDQYERWYCYNCGKYA